MAGRRTEKVSQSHVESTSENQLSLLTLLDPKASRRHLNTTAKLSAVRLFSFLIEKTLDVIFCRPNPNKNIYSIGFFKKVTEHDVLYYFLFSSSSKKRQSLHDEVDVRRGDRARRPVRARDEFCFTVGCTRLSLVRSFFVSVFASTKMIPKKPRIIKKKEQGRKTRP